MADSKDVKDGKEATRESTATRSGIPSPYFDLSTSLGVAGAIYQHGGGTCSPDQLAAWLGYKSTSSGTYMTRLAAATKHFGLVEVNGDRITISERARKILSPVMPEDALGAKVEAFLAVPLFSRVYEQFKGSQLPQEDGLKNLFRTTYAILPDRVGVALRVFLNSAEQAGFFQTSGDRTRLIKPSVSSPSAPASKPPTEQTTHDDPQPPAHDRPKGGSGSDGTGGVHSAIIGLLRDLPPPGTDWPKKQKARFVKAFQATLDFVYPSDDEDDSPGGGQ